MRQLSSLDAQFLNVESARIYGHVAFLGIGVYNIKAALERPR